MEYQQTFQRNLEQRIEQLLLPIVGPGRAIARVNADLDFNRTTIRKEIFDPKSAVVRSEVKSEEENRGRANVDGGTPDPKYQGKMTDWPQAPLRKAPGPVTTNFDINKEEQQIVAQLGAVKRLSVAVLVDGKYVKQADGSWSSGAPDRGAADSDPAADPQRAVGFDDVRGDAIEVFSGMFLSRKWHLQPILH